MRSFFTGVLVLTAAVTLVLAGYGAASLVHRAKNPEPKQGTCVVDGRTVYCILPAQSDEPVRHGEAK